MPITISSIHLTDIIQFEGEKDRSSYLKVERRGGGRHEVKRAKSRWMTSMHEVKTRGVIKGFRGEEK